MENEDQPAADVDDDSTSEDTTVAPRQDGAVGTPALFEAQARSRARAQGAQALDLVTPQVLAQIEKMTRPLREMDRDTRARMEAILKETRRPGLEAMEAILEQTQRPGREVVERIAELARRPGIDAVAAVTADLQRNTNVAQALLDSMAFRNQAYAAQLVSIAPLVEYEDWLREPSRTLWPARLSAHGYAVNSLVARDALLVEDGDLETVIETVEVEVLQPWQEARAASSDELYARLDDLDPGLAPLLKEGWHALASPGPAWVTTACNAPLEALQRALRTAAPDAEVRIWAHDAGFHEKDIESGGRLTRTARVRYVMRGRRGERKLVEAEIEAVSKSVDQLVGRLNAGKHASEGDLQGMRMLLLSTEAILTGLLIGPPDDPAL